MWKIIGVIGVLVGAGCCYYGGVTETQVVALVGAVFAVGVVIKAIFFSDSNSDS